MRLSPTARRNLFRILPFGVIWFLLSLVFLISDYAAVGSFNAVPDTAIKLDPGIFIFASLAVSLVGMMVGAIEILYLNNRFTTKSLTRKIVYKTVFYAILLFAVTVVLFPIAATMELDTDLFDARVWAKLGAFLTSTTLMSTGIQLGTSLLASLFYSEISEHMGYTVLLNFLRGRYHTPKEETRIFLFSDMKSSTRIAEQLGHTAYFELLRAYYTDLSDAIVAHAGEIYQYVGDEVIVSWPVEAGVADGNCLACFFAMKADLRAHEARYRERFGVMPDFKAGLHVGPVTTGEIGALKKEIIFTGDVLNATARIQGLCNTYGVDLLVSGDLLSRLAPGPAYTVRALGHAELRGKAEAVELYTVESAARHSSPSNSGTVTKA